MKEIEPSRKEGDKGSSDPIMELRRRIFIEKGNYIPINEILSYNIIDRYLYLHLAPSTDLSISVKRKLIQDGFRELANIVNSNLDIDEICASSNIVVKNPKLLEHVGFEIDKSISTRVGIGIYRKVGGSVGFDNRPFGKATMSREKFLKRYLNSD